MRLTPKGLLRWYAACFGPVRARVNTKSAKGEVPSGSGGMMSGMMS